MTAILKNASPLAAAFGLVALAAMPTFAADVVMEEPPAPTAPMEVAPVASWAGPYAGVFAGYSFSSTSDVEGDKLKTKGFLGGTFVGYNYQMDSVVIGAEADIGYSGVKSSDDNATLATIKSGTDGSLRARLGYVVTPDIFLYGTAGGAGKRVKATDGRNLSDSSTTLGWTAGVGTDVKLTDKVFGRVEYRYTDYGSKDFDLSVVTNVSNKENHVQFGVGMKF